MDCPLCKIVRERVCFLEERIDLLALAFQIDEEGEGDSFPAGIFQIKAVIKDHMGKKDLKLSTTFEVLPKKQDDVIQLGYKKEE